MTQPSLHRTILTIMDGHGIAPAGPGNAVTLARTPNLDRLYQAFPTSRLNASGLAVGLPEGQMGNSEVGHLNLGAGRVVYQDITRIDQAIKDGSFFKNPVLVDAIRTAMENGRRLHLMGLVSDGGVHAHLNHIKALLGLAKQLGCADITVHAFTDGRDTPPDSGLEYIRELANFMAQQEIGEIGTITGRYFAMDRDRRWERLEQAWNGITAHNCPMFETPVAAMQAAYQAGETDEFITPRAMTGTHVIADGDAVICFNFRADRMRQLCHVFLDSEFDEFPRQAHHVSPFVTFTEYEEGLPAAIAFPPERLTGLYGEVVAAHGRRQLRIAETEKYAHVTFFFNGGEERTFEGEERTLVPSPRIATYDLQPEMSAPEVTRRVVEAIGSGRFDTIILNFANCDMVGHTGVLAAAIRAVETVDHCVGQVADAALAHGWDMLLTADHGNAEQMLDEDGGPFTAHTTNPVPVCLISERFRHVTLREGALQDVAPTLLMMLGLDAPADMTGQPLFQMEAASTDYR